MEKITFERKLIYLLLVGFFPILFVAANYMLRTSEQRRVEDELFFSRIQLEEKYQKEFCNNLIKNHYDVVDHFYIDKQLEKLPLLSKEVEILQDYMKTGFHPEEQNIKKRLEFLKGGENRLSFVESSEKVYAHFQETLEVLAHPVEVHIDDLKAILTRVEGQSIGKERASEGKPHFLITDFRIDKKKTTFGECYLLNLKILKREYFKK